MLIGYARVSTPQQSLEVQLNQLKQAGCEVIYKDKKTGSNSQRPNLQKLLGSINSNDTLIVASLDRLARSTTDLLSIASFLEEKGVHFRSLREPWADTTTTMGTFMLTIFGGVAEFERNLTMERCQLGRAEARTRGVKFGRKPKLTGHQCKVVGQMLKAGDSLRTIATHFNVGAATIHRIKKAMNCNVGS